MMLKSILNILFFTVFLFALKSNVLAQCGSHPTVASPPIEARVDPTLSSTRTNELCNGQPLTLVTTDPSVCSGCTYLWSDGSTGPYLFVFNPGVYRVTVTDNAPNGCTGVSSQITLVSSTISLPQINGDSFNLCIDVNNTAVSNPLLEVSNPCATCSYQWYQNTPAPASAIGGATGLSYEATTTDEFYVEVTSAAGGCTEKSEIIDVGLSYVTKPPISASTLLICDTNTTTLLTQDCPGCTYEWFFYDFEADKKLIITAVYDATRPGESPRGIELYAQGNIADLSQYEIGVAPNGSGTFTYVSLPAVSLTANQFYYVSNVNDEFTRFFGFPPNYVDPLMEINGTNAIRIRYNGTTVIDELGDASFFVENDYSVGWNYNGGHITRIPNLGPSNSYISSQWTTNPTNSNEYYVDTMDNYFFDENKMPIGTYDVDPIEADQELIIAGLYAADFTATTQAAGIQLYAAANIPDLAAYSIRVYHNGQGAAQQSSLYTFPASAGSLLAGQYVYLTDDTTTFKTFFGADVTNSLYFQADVPNNILDSLDGDDAVVLYRAACEFNETNTLTYPSLGYYNTTSFAGAPNASTVGGQLSVLAKGDLNSDVVWSYCYRYFYSPFGGGGYYAYVPCLISQREVWQIFDENGVLMGELGGSGTACSDVLSFTKSIPQADIDNWVDNNGATGDISFIIRDKYGYITHDQCATSDPSFVQVNLNYRCVGTATPVAIDIFGDTNYQVPPPTWDFTEGWVRSSDTRKASLTFDPTEWNIQPGNFSGCTNNSLSGCNTNGYSFIKHGFPTYASDLVISAVFDGSPGVSHPHGIELYALNEISAADFNNYKIRVTSAGGSVITYSPPPVASKIDAGTYVYLCQDVTKFNTLFGSSLPGSSLVLALISPPLWFVDGNDAIELIYDFGGTNSGNVVDMFGNLSIASSQDFSMMWSYQDGWAYRNNEVLPSQSSFDSLSSWTFKGLLFDRPTVCLLIV